MNKNQLIQWLKRRRVAVLKGGWSTERAISLKTGAAVEAGFRRLGIHVLGIDVQRNLSEVLRQKKVGFCFIGLHGAYGEDGRIQSLLEILNIPYTGCGPLSSAVAMDKNISKQLFIQNRVPTAPWVLMTKSDFKQKKSAAWSLVLKMLKSGSVFVKPADQGSAIGISRVDKSNQLSKALSASFKLSELAIVERYLPGRELTVGILGNAALPVVEILPIHKFYDFHSKYAKGGSRHIVPANLSPALARHAQKLGLDAFRALGGTVYGRVDLIMKPNGEMHVLEVNTIPGMTNTSLLPDAARAQGYSFEDLVLKIVELSINKS